MASRFAKGRFKAKTKSINVLVIGESGVGKSTFINALANYLTYDTLEEAEKNPLICKIPVSFTITDDNFKTTTVKVGPTDSNERHVTGKAATIGAKTHTISYNNLDINIIDSAGIGDPDGFHKDQENIKNLVKHISQIPSLNAICFLLKPNTARLEIKFRYCLNELLSNLDKQASANIAFCFTCSTITSFKPGDSFPILRQFMDSIKYTGTIDKSNVFFFDNESFRHLAAKSFGIESSADDRQLFLTSWNKSSKNAKDLIKYIDGLEPYNTTSIVHLDRSRSVLSKLSKVIIETVKVVQSNLKTSEESNEEIEKLTNMNDSLLEDENQNSIDQINNNNQRIKVLESQIIQIRKVVNGYLDEQETILEVCVKCAGYTQEKAIVAYNDALVEYLDIIIEEEKSKVTAGKSDDSVLNSLREVKENYIVLKKHFYDNPQNNDDNNIEDLNKDLQALVNFRNTGKMIKELLEND